MSTTQVLLSQGPGGVSKPKLEPSTFMSALDPLIKQLQAPFAAPYSPKSLNLLILQDITILLRPFQGEVQLPVFPNQILHLRQKPSPCRALG